MEYFHFKPYNHMLIQMNEMKLIILTNSSKINGNIRKSMNFYSFCWKLWKIIKNSKMWPTSRKLKWIKGGGGTFVRLKTSGNIHEIYNLFCVNHQLKDVWIKLKIKERKWSNVDNHQTFKETKTIQFNWIQLNQASEQPAIQFNNRDNNQKIKHFAIIKEMQIHIFWLRNRFIGTYQPHSGT